MEEIEIAKEFTIGLLERMGVNAEVEGFINEGNLCLEIKKDQEGMLIGKNGRTLDSLQMLINRMVNRRLKNARRVILDIDGYRRKRADNLASVAHRLGEKAKRVGHALTVGPFSAHDRRIIHLALKEDLSLKTESLGEGELKKVKIVPLGKEG